MKTKKSPHQKGSAEPSSSSEHQRMCCSSLRSLHLSGLLRGGKAANAWNAWIRLCSAQCTQHSTVHTAQLDSTAQCTQHTARLDSSAQCTAGQAAASLCIWKASPLGKLHNLSGISCKIAMGDSRNTVYLPDPSSSLLDVLLGSYICSVFCVICVMCVFCCANVASVQMLQLFRGEWQWLPLLYKVSSNQMRIKWES